MLISYAELDKFAPTFNGAIHGGAHAFEEYDYYGREQQGRNKGRTFWVEADPDTCQRYADSLASGDMLFNYALWEESDLEIDFNRANNDQSSSVLELGTHNTEHPEVHYVDKFKVNTVRIDDLAQNIAPAAYEMAGCDFLALDIQGAELQALKGAQMMLATSLKYLYLEVNSKKLYEGCATLPQVDRFLDQRNFKRVITEMTRHGWGDCLYIRKDLL